MGTFTIHRKTGAVSDANAIVIPVTLGAPARIYGALEREALQAMRRISYEPIADAPDDAKTRLCLPFSFRLS